jgi:hypothetical protein
MDGRRQKWKTIDQVTIARPIAAAAAAAARAFFGYLPKNVVYKFIMWMCLKMAWKFRHLVIVFSTDRAIINQFAFDILQQFAHRLCHRFLVISAERPTFHVLKPILMIPNSLASLALMLRFSLMNALTIHHSPHNPYSSANLFS